MLGSEYGGILLPLCRDFIASELKPIKGPGRARSLLSTTTLNTKSWPSVLHSSLALSSSASRTQPPLTVTAATAVAADYSPSYYVPQACLLRRKEIRWLPRRPCREAPPCYHPPPLQDPPPCAPCAPGAPCSPCAPCAPGAPLILQASIDACCAGQMAAI